MLHIRSAEYRGGHRLRLTFSDGVEGEVDLSAYLDGPVFVPLRDPAIFAAVTVDPSIANTTVISSPRIVDRAIEASVSRNDQLPAARKPKPRAPPASSAAATMAALAR